MRFDGHYREKQPGPLRSYFKKHNTSDHKIDVWNAFVDSDLTGINDDDCAILPRVLPASYLPTITKSAYEITLFVMRLLSLPKQEIEAIIPKGPIRDFLISELEVLKYRPNRITGTFRFDMAIAGSPVAGNAPKLLEINEIGFDGLARSSFIQETLLRITPGLSERVFALDTANSEARNMKRLGRNLSRFQYDSYNWEEEVMVKWAAKEGVNLRLISPGQFGLEMDEDLPLLAKKRVSVKNGRVQVGSNYYPDAVQFSYSFELKDYLEKPDLFASIVRSKTPQYGPFLTGLVAAKTILILISDDSLRRRLLGSSEKLRSVYLPAFLLEGHEDHVRRNASKYVLKHTDGMGGSMVFLDQELRSRLKKISKARSHEWVVQKRTKLNTIDVNGILSRPRQVISDLGVFVQYDWAGGKFRNFEVGGFITRATNSSYKVNVSGGGLQVPVMFAKGL